MNKLWINKSSQHKLIQCNHMVSIHLTINQLKNQLLFITPFTQKYLLIHTNWKVLASIKLQNCSYIEKQRVPLSLPLSSPLLKNFPTLFFIVPQKKKLTMTTKSHENVNRFPFSIKEGKLKTIFTIKSNFSNLFLKNQNSLLN